MGIGSISNMDAYTSYAGRKRFQSPMGIGSISNYIEHIILDGDSRFQSPMGIGSISNFENSSYLYYLENVSIPNGDRLYFEPRSGMGLSHSLLGFNPQWG